MRLRNGVRLPLFAGCFFLLWFSSIPLRAQTVATAVMPASTATAIQLGQEDDITVLSVKFFGAAMEIVTA